MSKNGSIYLRRALSQDLGEFQKCLGSAENRLGLTNRQFYNYYYLWTWQELNEEESCVWRISFCQNQHRHTFGYSLGNLKLLYPLDPLRLLFEGVVYSRGKRGDAIYEWIQQAYFTRLCYFSTYSTPPHRAYTYIMNVNILNLVRFSIRVSFLL